MSRDETRQKLAIDYGATDIVTERGDEGVAVIKDLTGGLGAHSVIEAVGTQESMMQAIRSTRPGGHVGYVGVNSTSPSRSSRPPRATRPWMNAAPSRRCCAPRPPMLAPAGGRQGGRLPTPGRNQRDGDAHERTASSLLGLARFAFGGLAAPEGLRRAVRRRRFNTGLEGGSALDPEVVGALLIAADRGPRWTALTERRVLAVRSTLPAVGFGHDRPGMACSGA